MIDEIAIARVTERGATRGDERFSEAATEDARRKATPISSAPPSPSPTTDRAMGLFRFATAGSVDDGKLTLIGGLLLDSKAIFEDSVEAVEASSQSKGYDYTDLALLTTGCARSASRASRSTWPTAARDA